MAQRPNRGRIRKRRRRKKNRKEKKQQRNKGKRKNAHTHNVILTKILFRFFVCVAFALSRFLPSLKTNMHDFIYNDTLNYRRVHTQTHTEKNNNRNRHFQLQHISESMVIINNTIHIYIERKLPTRLRLALKRAWDINWIAVKLHLWLTIFVAYRLNHNEWKRNGRTYVRTFEQTNEEIKRTIQ